MPYEQIITRPLVSVIGEPVIEDTPANNYTIGAYQDMYDEAQKAGFKTGALVCLTNDVCPRHEIYRPSAWGIVSDVLRYRPVTEPIFKPIRVIWCKSGGITSNLTKDLILLNEAPELCLIYERINKAKAQFSYANLV